MFRTINTYLHFLQFKILNKCMNYKQNILDYFLTHETHVLSMHALRFTQECLD